MTNEVLHGQCTVEENTAAFDSQKEGPKLKDVDRNGGQFFSCSVVNEHHFCFVI